MIVIASIVAFLLVLFVLLWLAGLYWEGWKGEDSVVVLVVLWMVVAQWAFPIVREALR